MSYKVTKDRLGPVVEMRGGGGGGGGKPPKCARKCANFRNLKANVQILDRKTPPPPNGLPYFAYWLGPLYLLLKTVNVCMY